MSIDQATNQSLATEYLKVELEQALETYRTEFSLLTRALGVLLLANITLVAYAIANRVSGAFIVGLLILPFAAFCLDRATHYMLPVLAVAVWLEQRYMPNGTPGLASTFLQYLSPEMLFDLKGLARDSDVNPAELATLRIRGFRKAKLILLAAQIGQTAAFLYLPLCCGWRYF